MASSSRSSTTPPHGSTPPPHGSTPPTHGSITTASPSGSRTTSSPARSSTTRRSTMPNTNAARSSSNLAIAAAAPSDSRGWRATVRIACFSGVVAIYLFSIQDTFIAKVTGIVLVVFFVSISTLYFWIYRHYRRVIRNKENRPACLSISIVFGFFTWFVHLLLGIIWIYIVFKVSKDAGGKGGGGSSKDQKEPEVDILIFSGTINMKPLKEIGCFISLAYIGYAVVIYFLYNHYTNTMVILKNTISFFNFCPDTVTCCPRRCTLDQYFLWKAKIKRRLEQNQRDAINAQNDNDRKEIEVEWNADLIDLENPREA